MGRRSNKWTRLAPSASSSPTSRSLGASFARTEIDSRGERWQVRDVTANRALKDYRCPGCNHTIAAGIAHVVAWPTDGFGSVDDRRHWHRSCWRRR